MKPTVELTVYLDRRYRFLIVDSHLQIDKFIKNKTKKW